MCLVWANKHNSKSWVPLFPAMYDIWSSHNGKKITVIGDVMPCCLVHRHWSFREIFCCHHLPYRWRQNVFVKCWYLSTKLHAITSQMTVIFIYVTFKEDLQPWAVSTCTFTSQHKCQLATCTQIKSSIYSKLYTSWAIIINCTNKGSFFMKISAQQQIIKSNWLLH